ncbi:MAG: protein translocase subunit SecDF [Muribaculaceae bacterium]|nr:protein translocase subunit SecDF [Muribaculaceae bacterium]
MQTKGFIRVLTYALLLICAFYLSFTFVSNHYQNKAEQKALAAAGIKSPDTSNEKYKAALNECLDSLANEKVYLGYYTFQQVREKELGLGLDLKGGMNVTLQISVPDILRALANNNPDKKFNQAIENVSKNQTAQDDFVGSFCKEYKKLAPEGSLAQIFRNIERIKEKPNANDGEVQNILNDEVNAMVDNSYKVLRNRIDRFGVVQPNIQKLQSTGRILLELPGVKEPERVRKLLQGAANLEFYETYTLADIVGSLRQLSDQAQANKTVAAEEATAENAEAPAEEAAAEPAKAEAEATAKAEEAKKEEPKKTEGALTLAQLTGFEALASAQAGSPVVGYVSAADTAAVNAILRSPVAKTILPADLKLAWTVKPEKMQGGHEAFQLVALRTVNGQPVLNGDVVTRATSEFDNLQGQIVSMTMNDEGARNWSRITGQNIGKAIAIVLDDQVYSFPNVNSQIDGGRSQISGRFTVEEAGDLANVLESGKMVARVNVASESVIGPSLGKESIRKGVISFIVALILLMIFMVCTYGVYAGNIANLGLLMNLFFTIGILASFQSVLTLPGIAGIVLTLGMAVDANVLIFERCKEELRAGKGLKAAVSDGYKNAFSAIFDSNLTTIITGIILILLGSGPIRGFAVTLVIGICCSFFTAVFATRLVMEHFVNKGTFDKMTFTTPLTRNLLQNVSFDFMGAAKKTAFIALALIVIMGALFGLRGLNRGIDFSGGRNFVVQFDHPVSTLALDAQLEEQFPGANTSVITIDNDTKVRVSTNYKINDTSEGVDDEIMDKLYNGLKSELGSMSKEDFSTSNESVGVLSSETVGPSIASDMTRQAVWAVLFSLLAMALYILFRFRNIAFSIGALAAVAFTSFVVIGFYNLHGMLPFSMEIDQTFIAAILTVIGYQVNDTVVVFDRVREYRKLYPKQDLYTTFNKALCSTLSRTMMTSITTLLVLFIMLFLGGESIRSFIFAMILGVIIGTCSSLFIASPVAYWIARRSDKKEAALATARK